VALQKHFLGAIAALLCLQCDMADAACVAFRHFNLSHEGPWPGYGTIKAGHTCGGKFSAGGTWIFKRLYLFEAPRHGSVRLWEGGTYYYTAPLNYSGPDTFVLRVCGKQEAIDGCANLINNMTVQ
jgi:hypothetical protein